MTLSYSPASHAGLDHVELSIIGEDGPFMRQADSPPDPPNPHQPQRKRCSVTSGRQFRRTSTIDEPQPTEV